MIARVAFSDPVDAELAAVRRDNLTKRFKPALTAQPGFVAGYWLLAEDGHHISLTIFESKELMEAAGRAANAVPLLPGHRPEQMPAPRVEFYDIWDHFDGRAEKG